MESHGGRSLETPRGVAPTEQRTVSTLLSTMPLDVREVADPIFNRFDGGQGPPAAPPRPNCPVRVHSRPQRPIMTTPPPQTCVLQPVPSSGPIRTTNLVRSSSRTTSGNLLRNISDFAPVTISENRNNFTTISSGGRVDNSVIPTTPIMNGRNHSLSANRSQNTNQFSNSLTNSATRSRAGTGTGTGSVNIINNNNINNLNNSSSVEAVSLTLPRPETERISNEYVETPLRSGLSLIEPKLEPSPHRTVRTTPVANSGIISGDSIQRDSNFAMVTLPVTGLERNPKHGERSSHRQEKKVVTTQPSATFKKERVHSDSQCSRQADDFIICPECQRCRCESCRTPRPLPSKWLCGTTCHCSADAIVDCATCLCCAKAFFYHCSNDETVSYADDPCSCSPDKFYTRWGCLGVMTCFLPCLLCYWPCRGLVQICESCHQYVSSQGCRCQKLYQQPAPLTFEKRLLDSPE